LKKEPLNENTGLTLTEGNTLRSFCNKLNFSLVTFSFVQISQSYKTRSLLIQREISFPCILSLKAVSDVCLGAQLFGFC